MDRIVAENLSVEFPIYDTTGRSLRHAMGMGRIAEIIKGSEHVGGTFSKSHGNLVVRALNDISFNIADGEKVGIIGHNGCGKTTLLRVLAGIYEPTLGHLKTAGRIMPLFNMTEGMTPDATGMELIYVRGVMLGLTPKQISDITPDILEFCELGHYINMPVRTYSAGMLVRLAFAITTAISADILLFDELIGAGDAHFVERAQARLESFVGRSRTMVVATHSASIMRRWCNRAILMQHGDIVKMGEVDEVLDAYGELIGQSVAKKVSTKGTKTERKFLQPEGRLEPSNAAVALIIDQHGRYLVQKRDDRPDIFFPGHWGCFGGALEPGETYDEALVREMREELQLDVTNAKVSHFTDFDFDFGFAAGGVVDRRYYTVELTTVRIDTLTLGEGQEMRLMEGTQALQCIMVPYDRFAIWMHYYRDELGAKESDPNSKPVRLGAGGQTV